MIADSSPSGFAAVPSIAQVQMQSFVGGMLGRPVRDEEITSFTSRAREVQPKLTERSALVLFALFCASRPVVAKELPFKPTVLWIVLGSLHDLGLVEIHGEGWRASASLTDAGRELVHQ